MADRTLDASGLRCPMPLLKTKLALNDMAAGEVLAVTATDPGSAKDIPAWLGMTSHILVSQTETQEAWYFEIKCGG
ncbi:TusA-related sulfurtransferase [Marinobacter persicus]|uniref:TusA-related sulfurtransferase n=1 Tax=Marinobacter persicus TaxID=930118 RepID=A0A1I3TRK9_9GAMM|nr:sulfurtransferase TusA family protein [Marinobacter persicus]GHD45953.1 hypothetical protein GCM10008110_12380 [Marinobacter persicus]SFJ73232.1 TusA-related sulfurtransferase [Marinobacter persicus]